MNNDLNDEQIKQLWDEYTKLLISTQRLNMENLIKWLDETDFKVAPGSTKYHHAFRGGLLLHSLEVYYNLLDFKPQIEFFEIDNSSLVIMALLHDICKVNCYKVEMRNTKDAQGNWIKVPFYTFDELEPIGHSEKSIMIMYENGVMPTKLERACIRNHMGFTDQEYGPRVSQLFSKCPQALLLYWADLQSTYLQGSKDLIPKFRQKLKGVNVTQSLQILAQEQDVIINGTRYKLAPSNVPVDGVKVITLTSDNGTPVNVYTPYSDGLPI